MRSSIDLDCIAQHVDHGITHRFGERLAEHLHSFILIAPIHLERLYLRRRIGWEIPAETTEAAAHRPGREEGRVVESPCTEARGGGWEG